MDARNHSKKLTPTEESEKLAGYVIYNLLSSLGQLRHDGLWVHLEGPDGELFVKLWKEYAKWLKEVNRDGRAKKK